jgi:biopolymer transport protein ExbB/TolQ
MTKKSRTSDFLIEVFSLVIIITVVQGIYATMIRPRAEEIRQQDLVAMAADPNYVPELHALVVIKDYEPEICFIFAAWALTIMTYRAIRVNAQRKLLDTDLLQLREGMKILPEDSREYARQIESLSAETRSFLLPRALLTALHRFGATRNIQDVATAARSVCQHENDRLDSELSMVRFVAWAIPAIGFVGTVRGIGASLQQAHKAVEGDVSGVVSGLGTAFNATLVALSLSILVMLVLHQLQLRQERMVLDTEDYLDTHVVRHMLAR